MSSILDSVNQRTQMVGQNRLELLMFSLAGKQIYGINVFKVREVIQCPSLTTLPGCHHVVRGIAQIRGKAISVIDLSMAIGGPSLGDQDAWYKIYHINRRVNIEYAIYEVFYSMLTAAQIRAARALLRWSAQKLAKQSGVSWTTIQRMEASDGVPPATARNIEKIERTLEKAGVLFIDEDDEGPGVRLKKPKYSANN